MRRRETGNGASPRKCAPARNPAPLAGVAVRPPAGAEEVRGGRMAPATTKAAKYVYGVVRAPSSSRPKGKGIDGKPVRVIAADGLGALTSDVPPGQLEGGREE